MTRYHVHVYAHAETRLGATERDEGHHADGMYVYKQAAIQATIHALAEEYVAEVRIIKEGS